MSKRAAGPPANDNEPPAKRRAVNELPADLPITETELQLVETYFATMIAELLGAPANDNAPARDKDG